MGSKHSRSSKRLGKADVTWIVSAHAVDQYRARFAPQLSEDETRDLLERASKSSSLVGKRADGKRTYASHLIPLAGLVTAFDGPDGIPEIVTVIDLLPRA